MARIAVPNGIVGLGNKALRASRDVLTRSLGDEQAPACLQEIGYAAGEQLYGSFCAWLPGYAGVADPGDLHAAALGEVLSTFFDCIGWGTVTVEQLGSAGLTLASTEWAESDPQAGLAYPACFLSAGLLADFLTRLAGGPAVSIMEVECRSRGDEKCCFVAGAPETLEAAYEAISQGTDYTAVF